MRTGQVFSTFTTKRGESITLRSLSAGDARACTVFINQLVRERKKHPQLGITTDRIKSQREEEEKFLSKLLARVRKNDAVSVGAFANGRLVGNSDISRMQSGDMRHVGLLGIAILEGYRGIGLGQRVLTLLLENAKKIGLTLVELEVFANNGRAIHVYEKMGFREAGRIPGKIYRNGEYTDMVFMYASSERTDISATSRRGRRDS